MARFVIIEGDTVANIVESDEVFAAEHGWIPALGAAIGDLWNGAAFSKPTAAPPAVPKTVTMRQARLALLEAGKLADVDTAIDSLSSPDRERARIEWDYARDVVRDSPLIRLLGPALGLDETALDALFTEAATL